MASWPEDGADGQLLTLSFSLTENYLLVGKTPFQQLSFYDMHGNVSISPKNYSPQNVPLHPTLQIIVTAGYMPPTFF